MNNDNISRKQFGLKSPMSPVKNESFGELQMKIQTVNYDGIFNDGKQFISTLLMCTFAREEQPQSTHS